MFEGAVANYEAVAAINKHVVGEGREFGSLLVPKLEIHLD